MSLFLEPNIWLFVEDYDGLEVHSFRDCGFENGELLWIDPNVFSPVGSREGMRECLEKMQAALERPAIRYREMPPSAELIRRTEDAQRGEG